MQEIKFTTIRTKKGQFEVFDDGERKKYFLKYLEKGKQQPEKVGYLVKEGGQYFLQEAFFDKRNWPHTSFRSVGVDADMNKDLWDNLIAACYQIEDQFWCKDKNSKRKLIDKAERWADLINNLQKGTDLETAVRAVRALQTA